MNEYVLDKKFFNKIYLKHLNNQHRTQIYYGGSSSGKSYFLAQRCVIDIANGGRNYLIVRKTANTLKRSVFNEISKAISKFRLHDYFNINKSDLVITCCNGYQILFGGLDDTEKIKSVTPAKGVLTDIWVEEATEADEQDINQLNKRLRGITSYNKRLVLSFNPVLQTHWLYKRYYYGWDDSKQYFYDDELSILKTTYKDNEFLTQQDRFDLENEKDLYFYNVYTLGNWGTLGDVIFKNWRVEDLSEIKNTFDNIKCGLDFGFAKDPSALVVIHYDKKRKIIYVLDEIYLTDLTNDILADMIKPKIERSVVICDCSEPKSIAELNNHGVYAIGAKKGKDSVDYGIKFLQKHEIIVDVSCINFKNEISQYQWKKDKNGNTLPIPIDRNNHCLTPDTIINTIDGDIKISDLVGIEGLVNCYDEQNQKPTISKYFDVRKTQENVDVYEIELEDGRIIKATEKHPILTKEGWKLLKNLTNDDEIIDISNHI